MSDLRVVGVDLAGRTTGTTALVTLAGPRQGRPRVAHAREGGLRDDRTLVRAIADERPEVVAIDAPLALPHAVTCVDPACPVCFPADGGVPPVATRAAETAAAWRAVGHAGKAPMPTAMLAGIAFRGIYVARLLAREGLTVVETWPMGVYRALQQPSEAAPDGSDAWRATIVARVVDGVDAAPRGRDGLDGIAAAYTAWCVALGRHVEVGPAGDEGTIVVPRAASSPG